MKAIILSNKEEALRHISNLYPIGQDPEMDQDWLQVINDYGIENLPEKLLCLIAQSQLQREGEEAVISEEHPLPPIKEIRRYQLEVKTPQPTHTFLPKEEVERRMVIDTCIRLGQEIRNGIVSGETPDLIVSSEDEYHIIHKLDLIIIPTTKLNSLLQEVRRDNNHKVYSLLQSLLG